MRIFFFCFPIFDSSVEEKMLFVSDCDLVSGFCFVDLEKKKMQLLGNATCPVRLSLLSFSI
jgi:hypothetical protein